jgi:hypothetical protein
MKEILKHQLKIDIGYDVVDVIKAKTVIEEVEEYDNPVFIPKSDKHHTVKFVSEDGTVVADRDEISFAVWESIKEGRLKDGDYVGIEVDSITLVHPEKLDEDGWTPIFGEAAATLYSKIKHDKCGRICIYDLKYDLKYLEQIGSLKAQLEFFRGTLEGLLLSRDIPKRMKSIIKRVLKTKK